MKKILAFLLVSMSLMGQTVRRSYETRKDHANVFYNPSFTLFDLFSDEPIFPDANGKYNIIISSNENKSPQRFVGTGEQLSQIRMYKFKNIETYAKWARGEVAIRKQSNEGQFNTSSPSNGPDLRNRMRRSMEELDEHYEENPLQPIAASGGLAYFDGLISSGKTAEINLDKPQVKDKQGNYLWGDLNEQNRDGFGIMYKPNEKLQIGEFKDMKLEGSGLMLKSNGFVNIGYFKADQITGIGLKGYLKDSTRFLENVKDILKHNSKHLLDEKNFNEYQVGTYFRNEKNESIFDGKFIRNRFEDKSDVIKVRSHVIGRQVNSVPQGIVQLIIETPAGSSIIQGNMVYTGEVDANNSPKGQGFQYSISPGKYVRLSGEFKGLFEVNGSREHSSGIRHYGLIKDDNVVGEGRMEQDDKVITGLFKDYVPHGKVRIDYKNGDYFEGTLVNGSAQGPGVSYSAATDEKISGNFSNGRPNGKMKVIKGKKITMATYVDGQRK